MDLICMNFRPLASIVHMNLMIPTDCDVVTVRQWSATGDLVTSRGTATSKPCPHIQLYKGDEFIRAQLDRIFLEDHIAQNTVAERYGLDGLPEPRFDKQQNSTQRTVLLYQRLDMASLQNRLASFTDVTSNVLLSKKEELALAGFYFEGCGPQGDSVRCYSCHTTMFDIEESDDIWREHVRYSECSHVRREKGVEFILEVRRTNLTDDVADSRRQPKSSPSREEVCARSVEVSENPISNTEDNEENNNAEPSVRQRRRSQRTTTRTRLIRRGSRREKAECAETVYLCCRVPCIGEGRDPCPSCGENRQ